MKSIDKYLLTEGPWKHPTHADMKSDFEEYKVKEYRKWKDRAKANGFRFPIWDNLDHYKKSLAGGKVVDLNSTIEREAPSTDYTDMDDLRSLVGSYPRPRDIERIIDGFNKKQKMPYPVILKGSRGMFRLSGNTRTNTAKIMGIPVKVLVVDVSDEE